MRASIAVLLTFVVLVLAWSSQVEAADEAKAVRITQLVDQLGSPEFQARQEATQALDAIGAPALEALRKAATSEDREIGRRAADLVSRIERRVETARLIEPKHVQIQFKELPLSEAAAKFSRITGYRIQLEGDSKLNARKITLDTGTVPFWEAYEQFCRQAGVVERQQTISNETIEQRLVAEKRVFVGRLRAARVVRYQTESEAAGPSVVLVDGKQQDLPTQHAGAIRIRALPPRTPLAGHFNVEGEALLALDVQCDPHLVWQGFISMRVHKAIDDQGQTLVQPCPHLEGESEDPNGAQEVIVMDGSGSLAEAGGGGGVRVPLRLQLAKKPSQVVRELHGTVAARVEGPVEALMTVDNILKAAGQTVKGPEGSFLKVIETQRDENGRWRVKLQMQAPDMQPLVGGGGRRVFFRAKGRLMVMADRTAVPNSDRLALIDSKGGLIPSAGIESANWGNAPQEFIMLFQPGKDQGEPTKLVYNSRRSTIIEVPFTLKNMPLR
jgi:hypothetical protein